MRKRFASRSMILEWNRVSVCPWSATILVSGQKFLTQYGRAGYAHLSRLLKYAGSKGVYESPQKAYIEYQPCRRCNNLTSDEHDRIQIFL